MNENHDIFRTASDLIESREPFVLITVIRTQGSSPRDAGAKMIWRPRHGLTGTVGGGQFEQLVLDAAEQHFTAGSCGTDRYVLGADADQCCGGVMEVFFEYCGARQRLVIFGAGHVSQALTQILAPSAMELVVVDDRPDWNSAARFPSARRIIDWDEGIVVASQSPQSTLACVMTCSHETDLQLLRRLLISPPAFLGLIGSRSKRACLFRRLVASGVDESLVQKIHCPIGLGDMGKAPPLVAISMAGQLLLEAANLSARSQPHLSHPTGVSGDRET